MEGRTLSHFRILEKIGAGGMGEVYRAHDEHLDRDIAVKVLPPGTLADDAARQRFRREALVLGKLNHPNIQSVFDFDTQEGVDFLVTEYVPGVTLSDKLAAGPLPEKEEVRLGTQLAEGLAAAHEQGILHRDLKPSNLRVTPDGRLKILDFGVAKLLGPVSETAVTETGTGTVAGTPLYMSPEQRRGERVDTRSDLYSAGLVLWEMATGRPPSVAARGLLGRATPELQRIVEKCLEEDPGNRYQSAKELAVDLRRLGTPVVTRRLSRRAVLAATASLAALAVLVGLYVGETRDRLARLLGSGASPRIESLAVLPLENLSGDPEQEYFADGMTEALITDLAQISSLRVISRTSAMRYKVTRKPLPDIARELNVDAVIEGSVQRAGDRVRITAQLIHAPTDRHLWAKSYERDLRDVLALQGEVAAAIAREIKVAVTPADQARLTRARPVNPEAYEAYLKGKFYLNKFTPEGFKKGLAYLQQAIEEDPANPLPYAGLALGYSLIGHEAVPDAFVRAKAAARKALELGETLGETQEALAEIKLYSEWDYVGAGQDLRRALELNPSLPEAHAHYAWYLLLVGRVDEALAEMRRAQEVDPLNPLWSAWLGWQYWEVGRLDEAIAEARKSLELNPDFPWGLYVLGAVYAQKGMYEEAITAHQKAAAVSSAVRWPLGHTYALAGRSEEARKVTAELKKQVTPMNAWGLAEVYTALGEKDEALRWLEAGFELRFSWMPWIGVLRPFEPLRGEPRFQELRRRMNLPQN